MAQVVIGGDHDTDRHEQRTDRARDAGHGDMDRGREHADAARDHDRRADHDRDNDRNGVRLDIK